MGTSVLSVSYGGCMHCTTLLQRRAGRPDQGARVVLILFLCTLHS